MRSGDGGKWECRCGGGSEILWCVSEPISEQTFTFFTMAARKGSENQQPVDKPHDGPWRQTCVARALGSAAAVAVHGR